MFGFLFKYYINPEIAYSIEVQTLFIFIHNFQKSFNFCEKIGFFKIYQIDTIFHLNELIRNF